MLLLLRWSGIAAAIVGVLLCAASGIVRLAGHYYLAGYESTTLFAVGTGLMVFACLARLETLAITIQKE